MKILLTGATGYIGKRLLPALLEQGHEVICCVRNKNRLSGLEKFRNDVTFWEVDFLKDIDMDSAPRDFDTAYYLIHSLTVSTSGFAKLEKKAATNFRNFINQTSASQIIYLTGIVNEENLSPHLKSRKNVGKILSASSVPLTTLKAAIIVGSGSASFEIIRDLVEKLPIMIVPKWLNTLCQPIGVRDVVRYLTGCLKNEQTYNQSFDIGGSEVLTYKNMLLEYARIRNLNRYIFSVPVLGLKLSSYWLYFITSTSYDLAVNLVESMRIKMVCEDHRLEEILQVKPESYAEAVKRSFQRINENVVISSWKDAFISSAASDKFMDYAEVPRHGCLKETREVPIAGNPDNVLSNIWSIGGKRGWYFANMLWKVRGFVDRLFGGSGLRRGRTHPKNIYNGDALDFWRVIVADKINRRLLLYSEMKLPGEAWLEFKIKDCEKNQPVFLQTATFRPQGLAGRLYWYLLYPVHFFIFSRMARNIVKYENSM